MFSVELEEQYSEQYSGLGHLHLNLQIEDNKTIKCQDGRHSL